MPSLLNKCHRMGVIALSGILGIRFAISYLRNPAPSVSASLLRRFGAAVGERSTIKRSLFLDNVSEDQDSCGTFSHLQIGSNCYIGDCVYFDLANRVSIEDNAVIAGKVSFVTHADCNRSPLLNAQFPRRSTQIRIGRGAWIGFGATILDGVTVGEEAVVGAGSLVRQNVPPREVWVGVPAKFAQRIE